MASKTRAASIAIGVALLLSGCGGTKMAGNAAILGDTTIPTSTVTQQVNEVRAQIESMPKDQVSQVPTLVMLNQMILSHLVLERVIEVGLAAKGIAITDAQVAQFQDSVFAQYGRDAIATQVALQQGVSEQQLGAFMRLVYSEQILSQALVSDGSGEDPTQALLDYLGEVGRVMDVQIAPRFGEWNPNKLQVAPGDMTLSQPAPIAAAS